MTNKIHLEESILIAHDICLLCSVRSCVLCEKDLCNQGSMCWLCSSRMYERNSSASEQNKFKSSLNDLHTSSISKENQSHFGGEKKRKRVDGSKAWTRKRGQPQSKTQYAPTHNTHCFSVNFVQLAKWLYLSRSSTIWVYFDFLFFPFFQPRDIIPSSRWHESFPNPK